MALCQILLLVALNERPAGYCPQHLLPAVLSQADFMVLEGSEIYRGGRAISRVPHPSPIYPFILDVSITSFLWTQLQPGTQQQLEGGQMGPVPLENLHLGTGDRNGMYSYLIIGMEKVLRMWHVEEREAS